jgi:uncharacterized coiled-coil DUF342 family protein
MTDSNQPLEQQINQYESQLRHIDELLERAGKGAAGKPEHAEVHAQIEKVKTERNRFSDHLDRLKNMSPDDLSEEIIEESGPMGIWDALAQQLEKLVERIEGK